MALLLYEPGVQPVGQFPLNSAYTPLGGEVGILYTTGVDSSGYQIINVRMALPADTGPFYLLDDGLKGYGVYFGVTVTKTSTGFGSGVDNGARLGPATYAGSGDVTCWDKPGIYAITSDALDPTVTTATWKGLLPGAKLTLTAAGGKVTNGGAAASPALTVVKFSADESLVTTGGAVVYQPKLIVRFNPYGTF